MTVTQKNLQPQTIAKYSYFLLVIFTIVLPSGTLFEIKYKIYLLLPILFFFIYSQRLMVDLKYLRVIFFFFSFLVFYFVIANINDVLLHDITSHVIAISSLFSIIFFSLFLLHKKIVNKDDVFNLMVGSLVFYSILKIILCYILSSEIYCASDAKELMFAVFNYKFIGLNTGYFYRVHLPIDYLVPPVIYILLTGGVKYSAFVRCSSVFILISALVISYSRILYFYFAVVLSLYFIIMISNKKNFIALVCTASLLIICGGFAYYADFFVERFVGHFAHISDDPRMLMSTALIDSILDKPFFGNGLGASASGFVRFQELPWYYELQWLSIIMQFGFFGFAIILVISLYPVFYAVFQGVDLTQFGMIILYVIWLSVGIFNGFMLTSSGAIVFLLYLFYLLKRSNKSSSQLVTWEDI